jgi:hypothetical protein
MPDVDSALAGLRQSVSNLATAAERLAGRWSEPAAPGKWSPAEIIEHVSRTLEESARAAAGEPSAFPTVPAPLRWIVRTMFFNRVLKNGAFPKARAPKALVPIGGPATPADGRRRLEAAFAAFDRACRKPSATGRVPTTAFGMVAIADYARFQEIHTRHHQKQLPA